MLNVVMLSIIMLNVAALPRCLESYLCQIAQGGQGKWGHCRSSGHFQRDFCHNFTKVYLLPWNVSMSLSLFLSFSLFSIYLSLFLSFSISLCLSFSLSLFLSFSLSLFLSFSLSLFLCPSVPLSVCFADSLLLSLFYFWYFEWCSFPHKNAMAKHLWLGLESILTLVTSYDLRKRVKETVSHRDRYVIKRLKGRYH